MTKEIYLDYAASTPVMKDVIEAMLPFFTTEYANPSSRHSLGLAAERSIKDCRADLGERLACRPEEILFTSGGTESNNLGILGLCTGLREKGHVITSCVEHPSVLFGVKHLETLGFRTTFLPVDAKGQVSLRNILEEITPTTQLISLMAVNNELGTIQPVPALLQELKKINKGRKEPVYLHVDAAQAMYQLPTLQGADLLSLSGHKLFGPKGVGLLVKKKAVPLSPLFFGGGQEKELRPGTENTPSIVGFTKAFRIAQAKSKENLGNLQLLRQEFLKVLQDIPEARINSPLEGASHIVHVSFPPIPGEVLVTALAKEKVFVGTQSACGSKKNRESYVLKAIGSKPEEIKSGIRVSFSPYQSLLEIEQAGSVLKNCLRELRAFYR